MPFEIHMPKLSDTMEEGTVIRWIVGSGQTVKPGDAIAEVETDKADVEIEAERAGVVREIVVPEGGVAPVGAVIAVLDDGTAESVSEAPAPRAAADEPESPKDSGAGPAPRAEPMPKPDRGASRESQRRDAVAAKPSAPAAAKTASREGAAPLSSPVARQIAERAGIDLAQLRGSGPGGRIVKSDVEEAVASKDRSVEAKTPPVRSDDGAAPTAPAAAADGSMSRMRRTIAARMEKSKREIPHFYLRAEVDVGELVKVYEAARAEDLIAGLTVTHLLLRAIGLTLPRHPRLNALWVEDSIEIVEDVNVGIVVSLDDGLLVPVVKRVQTLGLRALVEESRALVERTRKGKFRSDDLVGGTISVSNIGMLDVTELTPIINAPQACILGVGAMRECAMVRDGRVVAGRAMTLTLACDHRVVNGVEAGRFLEALKAALEKPLALVVDRV